MPAGLRRFLNRFSMRFWQGWRRCFLEFCEGSRYFAWAGLIANDPPIRSSVEDRPTFCDWHTARRRLVFGSFLPDGPAGDQQAGGESRFGVAEGGEGGPPNLLAGLSGARNHDAGELRREALLEPLPRQQMKVAARHIDNAGGVLQRRQRRVVVRLGVLAPRAEPE